MNNLNPYPVTSTTQELKDSNKIIQKEHFKKNITNEKLKINDENIKKTPYDKLDCKICGKQFMRCNKSKHNKTKHHIFCEKLNSKWRETIINI